MERVERDRLFVNPVDTFSLKQVFASMTSPHVVLSCLVFFMLGTSVFGLAYFLPSIVNSLGFSPNKSQLLSVGPFMGAFVGMSFYFPNPILAIFLREFILVTVMLAYYSDRYKTRAIPIVVVSLLAVAGYATFLGSSPSFLSICLTRYTKCQTASTSKFTSYGALYLMVTGISAPVPIIATWISNNSEPHYRRATSIALGFITANAVQCTSSPSNTLNDLTQKFREVS